MISKMLKDMLILNCNRLKNIQLSSEKLSDYELGLLNAYSHTLNILTLVDEQDSASKNADMLM